MTGNEDWRFERAQQLGLIDTRPISLQTRGVPEAAPRPVRSPVVPRPAEPAPVVPLPARQPLVRRTEPRRLLARICGSAAALLLAASAGWVLRDMLGDTPRRLHETAIAVVRAPTTSPLVAEVAPRQPALPPNRAVSKPVRAEGNELPRGGRADSAEAAQPSGRAASRHDVAAAAARRLPAKAATSRGPAPKPSFDCHRATASVNRMICRDGDLAALDVAMADQYRHAVRRGSLDDERRLDREQAAFLNARGDCLTATCIAAIYRQRLDALRPR